MSIWDDLKQPFAWEEIDVKPQSTNRDKTSALAVAYFDARAVMERLDNVLGPENWKAEYREVHLPKGELGIICRLTVFHEGREVVREDGSDLSDIEPLKGGISGALKRAFSALGNRSLYQTDLGWHGIDTYDGKNGPQFKAWKKESLQAMKEIYEKQVGIEHIKGAPATNNDRKACYAILEAMGVPYETNKAAALEVLSKGQAKPFVSSKDIPAEVWKERRTALAAWQAGQKGISALDAIRNGGVTHVIE